MPAQNVTRKYHSTSWNKRLAQNSLCCLVTIGNSFSARTIRNGGPFCNRVKYCWGFCRRAVIQWQETVGNDRMPFFANFSQIVVCRTGEPQYRDQLNCKQYRYCGSAQPVKQSKNAPRLPISGNASPMYGVHDVSRCWMASAVSRLFCACRKPVGCRWNSDSTFLHSGVVSTACLLNCNFEFP